MINKGKFKISVDLLHNDKFALPALLVVLLIVNIPYWFLDLLPRHDTSYVFQSFYFFYNDFYINNELAKWIPYTFFGTSSDINLITSLSPSLAFAGLIGLVFRVKDVLLLFNLAIFIDQLILLTGTFLLARGLFKRMTTTIFVCLCVIGSTVLIIQIYWNFRIYYCLPLIFYFMLLFFRTCKPQYLLFSMFVLIVLSAGNVPYMVTIPMIAMVAVAPFFFFKNIRSLHAFKWEARDFYESATLLVLLIVVVGTYTYFILHSLDNNILTVDGRDPVTGLVPLRTFLTYGGRLGFDKLWNFIYPAYSGIHPYSGDITIYNDGITVFIGLIPLIFVFYGLILSRTIISVGFFVSIIIFILFSVGGSTSEFFYYYFPTAKHFRHIGHVIPILKFFLPFLAGFGVEKILVLSEDRGKTLWVMEALIMTLLITESLLYMYSVKSIVMYAHLVLAVLAVILLLIVRRKLVYERYIRVLVITGILLGILGYQGLVTYKLMFSSENINKSIFKVSKYEYQLERGGQFPDRMEKSLSYIDYTLMRYNIAFSFYQYDPCERQYKLSFANSNLPRFFGLLGLHLEINQSILSFVSQSNVTVNRDRFLHMAGCSSPKLRLTSRVFNSSELYPADSIIGRIDLPAGAIILEDAPELPAGWQAGAFNNAKEGLIEVKKFKANGLELEAKLNAPAGAWLYYADSWHPGWKAYVNGRAVKVYKANIAFKAIRLVEGTNKVSFVFSNFYSTICAYIILLTGISLVIAVLIGCVIIIRRVPSQ